MSGPASTRPAPPTPPSAPKADRLALSLRVAAASGAACLFLFSLLLIGHVLRAYADDVTLSGSLVLLTVALVALLAAGAGIRDMIYWRRSTRTLAKIVNEIRAGEAPLSDLDRVLGGGRMLVEPIRSVLLDLKDQKRINADLQEEMRVRILSRTDALERQLGALKAQTSRDALTGLNNRRAFDTMLPQVFNACRQSCEDLSVLMIDVDNFKPLNDTLGHGAGDEMLKSIGEIIRSSIREHDAGFRVGGDEFVILLPRASRAIGLRLAERLASLVDHLARPLKLPHPPALSIGVAALSDMKFDGAKSFLELADRRLYDAKQDKPNRQRRSVA